MKILFTLFLLCLATVACFAQTPEPIGNFEDGVTVPELVSTYNAIYMALIVVAGYVLKLFKVKYDWSLPGKRLPWIIAAVGLVLGVAFVQAGFSTVLPLLFSFLGAIGFYDIILKPFNLVVKTPANKTAS